MPLLGSRSRVSKVLSGRRGLSLKMIRALVAGLRIPAALLLGEPGRARGELSGSAGLDSMDAAHASAELSFLLHERFWGQGYATDAAADTPQHSAHPRDAVRVANHRCRSTMSGTRLPLTRNVRLCLVVATTGLCGLALQSRSLPEA